MISIMGLFKVTKKIIAPSRKDRFESMARKEAKKENDINDAIDAYRENSKIAPTDDQIKAFEEKLRTPQKSKPLFTNVDQGMKRLDDMFGGKSSLPEINNDIHKPIRENKRPRVLDDPWGKSDF